VYKKPMLATYTYVSAAFWARHIVISISEDTVTKLNLWAVRSWVTYTIATIAILVKGMVPVEDMILNLRYIFELMAAKRDEGCPNEPGQPAFPKKAGWQTIPVSQKFVALVQNMAYFPLTCHW